MLGRTRLEEDPVWSKGERCQALWSEDGEFYSGKISKLTRRENGQVFATVLFDGYSADESEEVSLSDLRKIVTKKKLITVDDDVTVIEDPSIQNESMFKPLSGKEQTSWLSEKFAAYEEDFDNGYSASSKSRTTSKKHKGVVVMGGQSKTPRKRKCQSENKTCEFEPKTSINSDAPVSDSQQPGCSKWLDPERRSSKDSDGDLSDNIEEELSQRETTITEGFNDEDLEKPRFKFTPSAAKIPCCLSDPDQKPVIQVPATMNRYLRDYQRDGIKFLYQHYTAGQGAILGDDMGLGKTVQVIGLLAALLQKQGNRTDVLRQKPKFIRQMSDAGKLIDEDLPQKTFLIICPGTVLYNWIDELDVWGYFTVGKYHGADKAQCLADMLKNKYEVVVTTFETYRDNLDNLNQVNWDAVFVDEVHKIKGNSSQVTKALRRVPTLRRFGLTGTALQNNMLELWCILDWAKPNCLGSLNDFKFNFVDPIENGQKQDSTKRELANARKKKQDFAQLRRKMLLRRTKMLIKDQLPTKDDNVVFCKLTPFQVSVYKAALDHPGMKFVLGMDQPCDCGSGFIQGRCHNETSDGLSSRALRFTFMHILLKIANHVALLLHNRAETDLSDYSVKVIRHIFKEFPQYFSDTKEASFRTLSDPKYCGKMKVLKGLLSIFSKDHSKVLLFSYSTKVLDILEQYLMTTGHEYRRLDGSTSVKKRMTIVREYNKDPNIFIFLISTKAGGIGLNLTGANRVIIFDPNWNPTHDLQAQDRAYRIGQRRNVQVYRLISAGSIEENMYLRQIYKQQLDSVAIGTLNAKRYFQAIAGDNAQKGELFGVKNMFQLRIGEACLTMDILQRNEKLESGLANYQMTKYITPTVPRTGEDNSDDDPDTSVDDLDTSKDMEDNTRDMMADVFGIYEDDDMIDEETKQPKSKSDSSVVIIERKTTNKTTKKPARPQSRVYDSVDGDRQPPHFTSVGDVFENCGVVHVHENRKVIGASKAEDHMTNCALQDVFERHQNTQVPAVECEPLQESSPEEEEPPPKKRGRNKKEADQNTPRAEVVGKSKVLIGQTPNAIRQKQFQKMVRFRKCESLVDLAEEILSSSPQKRCQILKEFYCNDNPDLGQIFKDPEPQETPIVSEEKEKRKIKRRGRPAKQKPNPTLGINFCTIPDSESFGTTTVAYHSKTSKDEEDDSLEIGKKVSPVRKKRMTTRARSKRVKGQVTGASESLFNDESWVDKTFPVQDDVENNTDNDRRSEGECDAGELLDEMDQDKDMDVTNTDSVDNKSILDDLFGTSSSNTGTVRRKPPPGKRKNKTASSSRDFGVFVESTDDNDDDDVYVVEDSNLLNESTLKDDSLECFSDPLKWKKRKKKEKKDTGVERLLNESDDYYEEFFRTGKMKKRDKKKDDILVSNFGGEKKVVQVPIIDESVHSCDKTPSLF